MSRTRFLSLFAVGLLATSLAQAANGPKPGESARLPSTAVTPENQHLFAPARGRLFEIARRADSDLNDRLEKLRMELLNALRSRSQSIPAPDSAGCENCTSPASDSSVVEPLSLPADAAPIKSGVRHSIIEEPTVSERDPEAPASVSPATKSDIAAQTVANQPAATRPAEAQQSKSQPMASQPRPNWSVPTGRRLRRCEPCAVSSTSSHPADDLAVELAEVMPMHRTHAPLIDGALTFDPLPIDDSPSVDEPANKPVVASAAPEDTAIVDNEAAEPPIAESKTDVPVFAPTVSAVSLDQVRGIAKGMFASMVPTLKFFGLWPETYPKQGELRRELASLEQEVATLQARIETLKRLANEQ